MGHSFYRYGIHCGDIMNKMVFIEAFTTDPAFNLAMEEYFFEAMPRDRSYFMTWQNDNAIIIGKHQNTLSEINLPFVQSHGIRVVRRLSGGGAVYHDLGNLNFTFITDAEANQQVDLRRFCQPIADTLSSLGVHATVDGRNDILIDGKKVSGNAQYVRQGRVMHHGTILFDSNLSVLGQALQVDTNKFQAKGIKSVRSRVANVRSCLKQDMTMTEFRKALAEHLLKHSDVEVYTLTDEDIAAIHRIRESRYALWEWNFGASPPCTLVRKARIEGCGTVEAQIQMESGCISGIRFCGDYFSTYAPEQLAQKLIGIPFTREACRDALAGCDAGEYITGLKNDELISLLMDQ